MIDILTVYIVAYMATAILLIHFVADFIFQTDKMVKGKSKSNLILMDHVSAYTSVSFVFYVVFIFPIFMLFGMTEKEWSGIMVLFLIYVFGTHYFTDWVTSRIHASLYEQGKTHLFFVTIGIDQLIHYITLFGFVFWTLINI